MLMAISYKTLSEDAVLIEFGKAISPKLLQDVLSMDQLIREADIYGITETVPAYASLAVFYKLDIWEAPELIEVLKTLEPKMSDVFIPEPKSWKIPTVYASEDSPDMLHVMQFSGLSYERIIDLHMNGEYLVYMLGFLPGFIYLGGMDSRLEVPRKKNPDLKAPAGSVAIGGAQTGIYALESPAGWYIIGHTEKTFFDKDKSPPAAIKPGDKVTFFSVNN
jgi:inhibitor of KinA